VNKIEDDFIHTQFFALIDRNGKVRGGVYDGLKDEEVNKLISDIKSLLKEKPDHFVNGVFEILGFDIFLIVFVFSIFLTSYLKAIFVYFYLSGIILFV
jgi:hypothetical protein